MCHCSSSSSGNFKGKEETIHAQQHAPLSCSMKSKHPLFKNSPSILLLLQARAFCHVKKCVTKTCWSLKNHLRKKKEIDKSSHHNLFSSIRVTKPSWFSGYFGSKKVYSRKLLAGPKSLSDGNSSIISITDDTSFTHLSWLSLWP